MLKWLRRRLAAFRDGDAIHREIEEEFAFHMEMRARDLMSRDTPGDSARTQAARRFGDVPRLREQGFDLRGGGIARDALADLRIALRTLCKTPARSAILIATVALGVGVNTAVFSAVKAILWDPLPFPESDRLITIHQVKRGALEGVSYPNFLDVRAASRSLNDAAVFASDTAILQLPEGARRISGAIVSANLFDVLRVRPLVGRLFHPGEDQPGGEFPALISETFWREQFHQRADIVGRPLILDGRLFHIAGVIPSRSRFPISADRVDYWITTAIDAEPSPWGGSVASSRGYPRYDAVIARLRPGVAAKRAASEASAIAGRIALADPKHAAGLEFRVQPALQDFVGSVRPLLTLLYGAVFCVLAVACANVATLLLVGAVARRREFAVRSALGARPERLVRQLLVESLVVAICGGIAGAFLGVALDILLARMAPVDTPRAAGLHMDPVSLLYALGISAAAGLCFGTAPALSVRRSNLAESLKEGARTLERGPRRLRPGSLLIACQIAISMVLACSAAMLTGSFLKILNVPRGIDSRGVLTASINLPAQAYPPGSARVPVFYQALLGELRRLPGVESVSIAQSLPMSGQNNSTLVEVPGESEKESATDLRFVDPGYFDTLRIPLIAGRYLSDADSAGRAPVAVVNRAFAARFLNGRDARGAFIKLGWGGDAPKRIVGVVGDVRHAALSESAAPEVYVPVAQFPITGFAVLLRAKHDPYSLAGAVRDSVRRLDPTVPVEDLRTLEDYLRRSAAPRRLLMWVLSAFAASALLLAAIGLYGVLSDSTARRRHEFGVRMALGSHRWSIVRLVLREGLGITVAGIAAGFALTLAAAPLLARWLYATSAADLSSMALAAGVLLLAALAACWAPARRATRVSPLESLRGV